MVYRRRRQRGGMSPGDFIGNELGRLAARQIRKKLSEKQVQRKMLQTAIKAGSRGLMGKITGLGNQRGGMSPGVFIGNELGRLASRQIRKKLYGNQRGGNLWQTLIGGMLLAPGMVVKEIAKKKGVKFGKR